MSFEHTEPTDPADQPQFNDRGGDAGSDATTGSYDGITAGEAAPGFADLDDQPPDDFSAEVTDAERAEMNFNFRVVVPPTVDETAKVQEKEASVDWLGFVTKRSPIITTFGGSDSVEDRRRRPKQEVPTSDEATDISLKRIPPELPAEIVDRQLDNFSSTLTRVEEGRKASADLAELTAEHAGRSVQHDIDYGKNVLFPGSPTTFFVDGYTVTTNPQATDAVVESSSATRPDVYRIDQPNGETHLIGDDGSTRVRVFREGGRANIIKETKYSIDSGDADYFNNMSQNLGAYKDVLLQVTDHAGFNRDDIVDPESGEFNVGYLLSEVDPKIRDPEFQASLPDALRTTLEVRAQAIARSVNPTHADENNLHRHGYRVARYFRAILGYHDS